MTFGEKLQKLRAREGLSQDALSELLDVSRQAVSKWERDEAMPEAEKLVRISDWFAVTIDSLLRPEREPEAPMPPGRRAQALPELEELWREVWPPAGLGPWQPGASGAASAWCPSCRCSRRRARAAGRRWPPRWPTT